MWMWFSFIFLTQTARSACDTSTVDLNTATLSELASLPFISSSSAELISKLRPICSPQELASSPKKINGITTLRLNNHWNWHSDKACAETCCLADASCESHTAQQLSAREIYEWQTTSWSDCSAECNTGSQSRDVTCFNSTHTVSNSLCLFLDELPPLSKQLCNTHKCPNYQWVPHQWSTCHLVRDQCLQTRDILCYNTVDNNVQPDAKCGQQSSSRLANTRLCDIAQCDMRPLSLKDGNILSVDMDTDHDTNTATDMDTDSAIDFSKISLKVHLKQKYNHDKCHTSLYTNVDNDTLIARRGCSVVLDLEFSGLKDISVVDASWFKLVSDMAQVDITYKAGQITFEVPDDAHIYKYKYELFIRAKSSAESTFNLYVLFNPYSANDDVHMKSDVDRAEYVENDVGLVWLGSSQYNQAKHWIYGQYEFKNLEVIMGLLDDLDYKYRNDIVLIARFISYAVGGEICRGNWGSGSFTTGHPRGGYECDDDNSPCHNPSDWTGTSMMLDVYRAVYKKTGRHYPVQYCQCWVFAGATTTAGRALGIPTRSVSNFQSAHDTDFNRGIETYFILDEEKKTYKKTDGRVPDSVWNFHVWNEMYFKRNDFTAAKYNTAGWQVVDATPQEESYGGNPAVGALNDDDAGEYQLGPAAKDQIKSDENPNECAHAPPHRKRFGCFDNEFVISEVKATYNLWLKSDKSSSTEFNLTGIYTHDPFDPEYGTIGQHMSTKKPEATISEGCANEIMLDCESDRLDVTETYKESGESSPGMPTNMTNYHKVGAAGYRRRLWSDDEDDEDLDYEGIDYAIEWVPKQWYISPMLVADDKDEIQRLYDTDATYGMMEINIDSYFDHSVQIYCSFFITAHNYRGNKVINDSIKEEHDSFSLNAGQGGSCLFYVNYTDYAWLLERHSVDHFKFVLSASVYDGIAPYQNIIKQRNVLLCVPDYYLQDRIVCAKGMQWKAPAHDLEYECSAREGVDTDSVGDGYCDAHNNIDSCYDGGDCCQTSCVPSSDYFCEYFDCIDHRLTSHHNNYVDCPQALSFIDYMNDVSVCADVENEKFECADLLSSQIENECLAKVYAANGVFGKIGACYDQTSYSIQNEIQPIIEFVVDCVGESASNTTTTAAVFKGHGANHDKQQNSAVGIVLVVLSVVFVFTLVAVAYYLFTRQKKAKQQPYGAPFVALKEQDVDL